MKPDTYSILIKDACIIFFQKIIQVFIFFLKKLLKESKKNKLKKARVLIDMGLNETE
jgi:hypothetical protein